MTHVPDSYVRRRQDPLRDQYQAAGTEIWSIKGARSIDAGDDAFHGTIEPGNGYDVSWRFGIDESIGGYQDLPNPGDILCAALAGCQKSTLRMVADRLGIVLDRLEVSVQGAVDVRGTLLVDETVPVGFQTMTCKVRLSPAKGTDPQKIRMLCAAAEHSSVILQTLRSGVAADLSFDVTPRDAAI